MFLRASAVLLLFVLQATAGPHHRQSVFNKDEDCPKGVHIIGVRGTTEEAGFGALKDVVDRVVKKIPGSTSLAIDYPAGGITIVDGKPKYNFFQYVASLVEGVSKFKTEVESFSENCPDTKIVIIGYSQGAHVLGSGICGGGGGLFPQSSPIDDYYSDQLSAIIQLGDPTNVSGLPWHVGNGTKGGIFPRQNFSPCSHLEDKWQSYCDDNDLFCDRGDSIPVHLGYVERYRDNIVDFIVKKHAESQSRVFGYRVATDL